MANRRMFSRDVVETDRFLGMTALYRHQEKYKERLDVQREI